MGEGWMEVNYYKNNLESMKCFQSGLYEGYQKNMKQALEEGYLEEIETVSARDGEGIVRIRMNSVEYRLNSAYRPLEEAKKWAKQYELLNLSTVISMFGLGNGLLARALCDRMDETDYLLLYEPCPEIFQHVICHYDISDLMKRKNTVIIVESINDTALHRSLFGMIDLRNFKSQLQCIYPNYDRIFATSCLKYYKVIKGCFAAARMDINTGILFGETFIENSLRNLSFLRKSISLTDIKEYLPVELPAIVVAAGPSVRDNLEELRRAKGRAVIFAVDRILDYLLNEGIEPDFAVTIDPMKKLEHFSLRENITIPLICLMESNPEILLRHRGVKILCSNSSFLEELFHREGKEQPRIATGGSVAIVAYTACVTLGFHRVILVGQDLAYRDGLSHAGGEVEEIGREESIFVDGVDGEPVRSRQDWRDFVLHYQDLIEEYSDVEVIDSKESGARIKGTIVMSLPEAMKRYVVHENSWEFAIPKTTKSGISDETIIQFLKEHLPILKKIRRKAQMAIKECDSAIRGDAIGLDIDKTIEKLKKANDYIQHQKIYLLLNSYISRNSAQQIAELGLFTEDLEKNSDNTFRTSRAVYQATVNAVDFTRVRMKRALKDIEKAKDQD